MRIYAKQAAAQFGELLIGSLIKTVRYGDWPGGLCNVTELGSDEAAPEIVFHVRHCKSGEEIGVFDHEEIFLFYLGGLS